MSRKSTFVPLALGLGLAVALLWLLGLSGSRLPVARAASYTVCPAGPPTCDYSVVQDAVDAARDGDLIKVATGTYDQVNHYFDRAQVVHIAKSVTIRGGYTTAFGEPPDPEANPTTLDAGGQGRVIYMEGNIAPTIEGLRITGGDATVFESWKLGGGVFIANSTAILENNDVFSNTAEGGGGIWMEHSDATLANNSILSNTANGGAAIGMLECDRAAVYDNIISHNTAISGTGGLESTDGDDIILRGNTVSYNSGGWGGGLHLGGNGIVLNGNSIISNTATDHGGGLSLEGDIDVVGNLISFNSGKEGGGGIVVWGGSPTLIGNTIANNQTELYGGGVQAFWCTPTFFGNTFSENSAGEGGGMQVDVDVEDVTLNYNMFLSNTATTTGGGLYLGGAAVLNGNTFSRNSAQDGGGVLFGGSDATLTNNLIFDNQADSGSGMSARHSTLRLLHTTIALNTGGDGIGLSVRNNSTVAMTNTILVSHTVGIRVEPGNTATLESTLWGNELDWEVGGTLIRSNDRWGDPDFVDPGNGDYHIGGNSAALDAGVDAGVTADIDFHPRPYLLPDLGADEYWPPGTLRFIHLPLVMR
jgi:hypothetical protein